jgi:hypothetical protein
VTSYLKINVIDPDPDYLGIEISASSARFCGATRIYAGLDQLTEFTQVIGGFPTSPEDERWYEFGTKDEGFAGGYCALRFFCRDRAGHAAVDIEIEDDGAFYSVGSARFTIPVLPAEIDEFVKNLKLVEQAQSGEARLESKG